MPKSLSTTTGPQRLLYAGVAGIAVAAIPWPLDAMARGLAGWCTSAAVFLLLTWWLADTFDAAQTRKRAQSLDQPNVVILVSMLVVIAASVVAIAMLLQQVKLMSGPARAGHIALGLVALVG